MNNFSASYMYYYAAAAHAKDQSIVWQMLVQNKQTKDSKIMSWLIENRILVDIGYYWRYIDRNIILLKIVFA